MASSKVMSISRMPTPMAEEPDTKQALANHEDSVVDYSVDPVSGACRQCPQFQARMAQTPLPEIANRKARNMAPRLLEIEQIRFSAWS
jgi:hypothetical protein